MKYNYLLVFYIYLLMTASQSFADELPVLTLDEGENTIALSIVNMWNNDLADVTVEVERDNLPAWLTFQGTSQAVDVRSGTKGHEKLFLNLDVADAPLGAEAQVPSGVYFYRLETGSFVKTKRIMLIE